VDDLTETPVAPSHLRVVANRAKGIAERVSGPCGIACVVLYGSHTDQSQITIGSVALSREHGTLTGTVSDARLVAAKQVVGANPRRVSRSRSRSRPRNSRDKMVPFGQQSRRATASVAGPSR
jgi:hypothetical protein